MSELDELRQQAEQIRASGLLGKPGSLSRLFDFLLERSLAGEAPKEIEIAVHVFGKNTGFDVSQDSVVRVYVHKLRRRLDEFYARLTTPPPSRLTIRKGEYRLALDRTVPESVEVAETPSPPPQIPPPLQSSSRWKRWMAWSFVAVASAAAGAILTLLIVSGRPDWELRAVRNSSIWEPLLQDDLPVTIVMGDYYLLGETDESGSVRRLVREFFINSPDDFMHQVEVSPQLMARYRNVGMTYLPTASAFALQDIVPILAAKKRVRVMLMSELDGNMLKTTHIVYVGFISGMGILGDPVFTTSRLSPGGTYDELIDVTTDEEYRSSVAETVEGRYVDYGYFSTFPGPGDNRFVIISGTRDTGVMQTAEAASSAAGIADIARRAGGASSFEALYEVYGVARTGTNAKVVLVSPLKTANIWD